MKAQIAEVIANAKENREKVRKESKMGEVEVKPVEPIALLWTRSVQAIKVLRYMAEVAGTKINEQDKY